MGEDKMTTVCSFCGKKINENSETNLNKKYLFCPCGKGLIPKGANSYKRRVKNDRDNK
jgi:DNA-directed RNA polymerase subunit RPC12/RpoP